MKKILFVLCAFLLLVTMAAQSAAMNKVGGGSPQPFVRGQKLLASDREGGDYFGAVVRLSQDGRFMLVGAPYKDAGGYSNRGQIYIYERDGNNWVEVQKLTATDGSSGDEFGTSIAIAHAPDYTIVVGAPGAEEEFYDDAGAAYVFTYNGSTWSQQSRLPIEDENPGYNNRGQAVAITADGNRVFVGTPSAGSGSNGSIYVLARSGNNWAQEEEISGPTNGSANLGRALLLTDNDETLLASGWHFPSEPFNARGIVRVYRRPGSTWTEIDALTPSDGLVDDQFGEALAISDNGQTLLIGAPRHNRQAYVFGVSGDSWTEQAILRPPSSSPYTLFGSSVAMDAAGTKIVVGAWLNGSGGLHLFEGSGSSWAHLQTLHSFDSDYLGWAAAISSNGDMILGGAVNAASDEPVIEQVGAVYVFVMGRSLYLPLVMK